MNIRQSSPTHSEIVEDGVFGPTLSIIHSNIDSNIIQVHIPQRISGKSVVFKMKCEVTSNTTHEVLISKEVSWKSYKEICSGEPKKVNLGYNNDPIISIVENNTHLQKPQQDHIYGEIRSAMSYNWEVLSKFFSIHNIEPNWLDCDYTYGHYDDELGGWTGCVGKV